MIYELRIYRCVPGRKPALLSRFENETLRIWEKHGIRQAGFWTTLIGKSSQEITDDRIARPYTGKLLRSGASRALVPSIITILIEEPEAPCASLLRQLGAS